MQRRRPFRVLGSLFDSKRPRSVTPVTERPHRAAFAEPLEERLLMALSKAAGGSGYSGTLSTNTATRQQQLICDPHEPLQGSTSVSYDATVVAFDRIEPGPGYTLLEVRIETDTGEGTDLTLLSDFLESDGRPTETGYIQVKYQLTGDPGQLAVEEGNRLDDEAGVQGVDTHQLFFNRVNIITIQREGPSFAAAAAPNPNEPTISYTIFAAEAGTHSGNTEDFLVTQDGEYIGPDELSSATVSSNDPTTVESTGGPYTVSEGEPLSLEGTASRTTTTADDIRYQWDIGDDGTIDATGRNPTLTAAELEALGYSDGPATVPIRLIAGAGVGSASELTSVTFKNVAPTASANVPASTCNGPMAITLLATDPSAADRAAGFTYLVNWGDGTSQTITPTANNGAGADVTHDYADVGTYTITVRAVDKDGAQSAPFTTQIGVGGAELRPDPSDPTKLALHVCGSSGNDVIRFDKSGNGLGVSINGHAFGPFYGVDRVLAYGFAGNDDIRMNAQGSHSVAFFGGQGNDVLVAGNGPSILSGGDGSDTAAGGNGSDLVMGGRGGDVLGGGNGEDILVGGRTSYDEGSDDDVRALTAILNEWSKGGKYETRIDRITGNGPGALGSGSQFRVSGPNRNLFDDGASDNLVGGNGRDWLLLGRGDQSDLAKNEVGTTLLP